MKVISSEVLVEKNARKFEGDDFKIRLEKDLISPFVMWLGTLRG